MQTCEEIQEGLPLDIITSLYTKDYHLLCPPIDPVTGLLAKPASIIGMAKKMRKMRRKCQKVFGQPWTPVDMSLNDIERYGLSAFLQAMSRSIYFLRYLLEHLASENLYFYSDAEDFEMRADAIASGEVSEHLMMVQLKLAKRIFDTYIERESVL